MTLTIKGKSYPMQHIDDITRTLRHALSLSSAAQFVIELEADLMSGQVVRGGEVLGSFKLGRGGVMKVLAAQCCRCGHSVTAEPTLEPPEPEDPLPTCASCEYIVTLELRAEKAEAALARLRAAVARIPRHCQNCDSSDECGTDCCRRDLELERLRSAVNEAALAWFVSPVILTGSPERVEALARLDAAARALEVYEAKEKNG